MIFGAAAFLAVLGAGCAGSDEAERSSGPVVARVGDRSISAAEFKRNLRPLVAKPIPPERRRLVRLLVAQQLILAEWVEAEATRQGISVTPAEVRGWYEAKQQAGDRARAVGGNDGAYRVPLIAAGDLRNARRSPARADLLRNKLLERAVERQGLPAEARVRAESLRRKATAVPTEVREVLLITTKKRSTIERASAALKSGTKWRTVSKRYSVDDVFQRHPTGAVQVTRFELDEPLSRTVFQARIGKLLGPVHTEKGWYLARVLRSLPKHKPTLRELRAPVVSEIEDEWFNRETIRLERELRDRYRAKTTCTKGYQVPYCSNGPSSASAVDALGSS